MNIVGKKVGNYLYIHLSAIDTLNEKQRKYIEDIISQFSFKYIFNVIKLNLSLSDISFIYSPDFDISHEPYIKYSIKYSNGFFKMRKESAENPSIYHGKGFFVKDNYIGFNKQKSIERYQSWQKLNLNKNLIGRKKYWDKIIPLLKNNL